MAVIQRLKQLEQNQEEIRQNQEAMKQNEEEIMNMLRFICIKVQPNKWSYSGEITT